MRGTVIAIAAGGTLRCVETSLGGFVWLDPRECEVCTANEEIPADGS